MNLRVVFDTSVLVSAVLREESKPRNALLYALATCDICASVATLAELEQVLGRQKFDKYLDRPSRLEFAALIRRDSRMFMVDDTDSIAFGPACFDPKDDKFPALALAADASVLITGDEHLLVMNPWHGIEIVTPADFLSRSAEG